VTLHPDNDPELAEFLSICRQLKEMLDAGLINPEEYEAKKASLLKEM